MAAVDVAPLVCRLLGILPPPGIDGHAPADLEGYSLLDGGGTTPLPTATLLPGRFALIVNEAFMDSGGVDVPPAPGTLLLRVPHLGKNGLSNAGEPLTIERAPARTCDRRVERGEEVVLRLRGERGLRHWRAHRALENVDESSRQLTERDLPD